MQFIPGSHKWGKLAPVHLVSPQALTEVVPDADKKDLTPSIMRMKAGSCTFHNGLTFHYASANSTDRPRRAMVTIFMSDGTTYTGANHVVSDGTGLTAGQPFDGPMFPILAAEA
jgi:ectoine hydroxylase-related dioxygenase (phytanoyl-CoA dioxygenase family)